MIPSPSVRRNERTSSRLSTDLKLIAWKAPSTGCWRGLSGLRPEARVDASSAGRESRNARSTKHHASHRDHCPERVPLFCDYCAPDLVSNHSRIGTVSGDILGPPGGLTRRDCRVACTIPVCDCRGEPNTRWSSPAVWAGVAAFGALRSLPRSVLNTELSIRQRLPACFQRANPMAGQHRCRSRPTRRTGCPMLDRRAPICSPGRPSSARFRLRHRRRHPSRRIDVTDNGKSVIARETQTPLAWHVRRGHTGIMLKELVQQRCSVTRSTIGRTSRSAS